MFEAYPWWWWFFYGGRGHDFAVTVVLIILTVDNWNDFGRIFSTCVGIFIHDGRNYFNGEWINANDWITRTSLWIKIFHYSVVLCLLCSYDYYSTVTLLPCTINSREQ